MDRIKRTGGILLGVFLVTALTFGFPAIIIALARGPSLGLGFFALMYFIDLLMVDEYLDGKQHPSGHA